MRTICIPQQFPGIQFSQFDIVYTHQSITVMSPLQGSTVRNELLVEQDNPNVPRYLNNELGTIRRELGFLTFNTTAPPAEMFDVPFECKDSVY